MPAGPPAPASDAALGHKLWRRHVDEPGMMSRAAKLALAQRLVEHGDRLPLLAQVLQRYPARPPEGFDWPMAGADGPALPAQASTATPAAPAITAAAPRRDARPMARVATDALQMPKASMADLPADDSAGFSGSAAPAPMPATVPVPVRRPPSAEAAVLPVVTRAAMFRPVIAEGAMGAAGPTPVVQRSAAPARRSSTDVPARPVALPARPFSPLRVATAEARPAPPVIRTDSFQHVATAAFRLAAGGPLVQRSPLVLASKVGAAFTGFVQRSGGVGDAVRDTVQSKGWDAPGLPFVTGDGAPGIVPGDSLWPAGGNALPVLPRPPAAVAKTGGVVQRAALPAVPAIVPSGLRSAAATGDPVSGPRAGTVEAPPPTADLGRVAERVYDLLLQRLARERDRRGR